METEIIDNIGSSITIRQLDVKVDKVIEEMSIGYSHNSKCTHMHTAAIHVLDFFYHNHELTI